MYMEITVTNIIKKAGVARASFYRNFNSISDVIDALVDELSDDLIENVFPNLSGTEERKLREFLFNHFYQFLRRKWRRNVLKTCLCCLAGLIPKDHWASSLPTDTIKDKYSAVGKMGLINSITRKWLESGAKESPEEMIDYIMSLITLF